MRSRLFVAVASTMFVDSLLYLAVVPLLPWYTDRFELSKFGAALLLAGYPVTFMLVSAPAGWLASRVGARRVVIAGTGFFICATLLFAWAPSAEAVIVARLLQGVGGAAGWGAAMAWLTGNTPPERRSRVMGRISGVLAAGSMIGPVVGALAGATSPTLVFGLVGAVGVAALVLTIITPPGAELPRDPALHTTLGRLLRHPLVITAIAFSIADGVGVSAVDLLAPLALGADGVSGAWIGGALAAGAGLGVVAAQLAGRAGERFGS
ncbi:MAG: MFS transporter, partial [Gaiellales bacterium]